MHAPHARMEAASSSPEKFRAAIAADVSFADVDAAWWFALAWLAPLPAQSGRRGVTHATSWGVPWKLAGDATLDAGSYLIPSGTLEGDLTVGRGAAAVKRHLTIAISPRR